MTVHAPLHGAVVLAAGASQRLGRSKQLLRRNGETLVRRATRLAIGTRPEDAVIVLGAEADRVHAEVSGLSIRRIDCTDWRSGMGASLRAGIAALAAACEGFLVLVCDQPALEAAHLEQICVAWRAQPHRAVASSYAGRLGVPALLPRAWAADLRDDARGASALFARRADQVLAIANPTLAWDVDEPGDIDASFDEE